MTKLVLVTIVVIIILTVVFQSLKDEEDDGTRPRASPVGLDDPC